MSKVKDILDDVVTSCQAITAGNGFNQTIQTCKLQLDDYEQYTKGKYPFIFPIHFGEALAKQDNGSGYFSILNVRLACGLFPDRNADNNTAYNNMLADIIQKLEEDSTRGGNAVNTMIQSADTYTNFFKAPILFTVDFDVAYVYNKDDP